jgi:hypothetical protein
MTRAQHFLTLAAGVVIIVLTAAAFWLSYAHLHTVAAEHGLGGSTARAWAWPGCLDLFIVAGELLLLRASLARSTDWWAVGLVVVGSGGSIALNVFGVDGSDPLAYVTAAVPPTAALLAFGALMRQVHTLLAEQAPETVKSEPAVLPNTPNEQAHRQVFAPVSDEQAEVFAPLEPSPGPDVAPLATEANTGEQAPERQTETEQTALPAAVARLDTEQARDVIERSWTNGVGVRETARRATRSPSTVTAAFARLERERGPQPSAGQLALVK